MNVAFHEVQRLGQNPIVAILAASTGAFTTILLGTLALTVARQDWLTLVVVWGCVVGFELFLLFGLRLETSVITGDEPALRLSFRPLPTTTVSLREFDAFEPVRYDPIRDAGGWGVKWSKRYGRVYSILGDRAVWITGPSASYLVGSQRAEDLARALIDAQR